MNKIINSKKILSQIMKYKNFYGDRNFNKDFLRQTIFDPEKQKTFYWTKEKENYNILGLKEDTISIMEGINNINVNMKDNIIFKNEPLFTFESNKNNFETIYSPEVLLIVDINKDILKTINFEPESDESWIFKFILQKELFEELYE